MSDTANHGGTGPSHRFMEIAVAAAIAVLAVVGMVGSLKAGIGWATEGPGSGFFPFYVSLITLIACVVNIVSIAREQGFSRLFATWGQLRQVMSVVVPTAVYVTLVPLIGIYVSSAMLIAVFMAWLGRYRWPLVALVSIGVPVITYLMFERWFLVPLPKGPVENWLGF